MAVRAVPIWVCSRNPRRSGSRLGVSEFGCGGPGFSDSGSVKKWACCSAMTAVDKKKKKPLMQSGVASPVGGSGVEDEPRITQSSGFHRDLQSLPKPLSAADLYSYPNDASKVRVAYQGIPGAYGEAAALKAYPMCETVPCDQFEAAFKALDQCEMTLNQLGAVRVNVNDSAGAAQMVASEGTRDTGAIASARAAEIYGLNIIAEFIQDYSSNITRYLILAREPLISGTDRPYKTSIVFALEEGPGVLFKALACFSLRDINLSKIESRPQRNNPLRVVDASNKGSAKYFDYLFYIDFEASMAEPRAQYALGHLQEIARFIRVLGCYPMDTPP